METEELDLLGNRSNVADMEIPLSDDDILYLLEKVFVVLCLRPLQRVEFAIQRLNLTEGLR